MPHPSIRVGFIGTGWPDKVQIPAFARAGLMAQGICSGQIENARRVSGKHGIPEVHDSWESLIASESIDLVSIVTPTWLHSQIAKAALKAGKHVLCEAPTLSVAQSKSMVDVANAHPTQLALFDFELRHTPQRRRMYDLIDGGDLGGLISIQLHYRFNSNLDSRLPWNWEHDLDSGGGMLNLVGGHLLDQACWLAGPIEKLTAQFFTLYGSRSDPKSKKNKNVTGDDYATLLLKFENGTRGVLTVSTVHPDDGTAGLTAVVHGTEGGVLLDKNEVLFTVDKNGASQLLAIPDPAKELLSEEDQNAFACGTFHMAREIKNTLLSGQERTPHLATFNDGLMVQKAIEAARRSGENETWEYVE